MTRSGGLEDRTPEAGKDREGGGLVGREGQKVFLPIFQAALLGYMVVSWQWQRFTCSLRGKPPSSARGSPIFVLNVYLKWHLCSNRGQSLA